MGLRACEAWGPERVRAEISERNRGAIVHPTVHVRVEVHRQPVAADRPGVSRVLDPDPGEARELGFQDLHAQVKSDPGVRLTEEFVGVETLEDRELGLRPETRPGRVGHAIQLDGPRQGPFPFEAECIVAQPKSMRLPRVLQEGAAGAAGAAKSEIRIRIHQRCPAILGAHRRGGEGGLAPMDPEGPVQLGVRAVLRRASDLGEGGHPSQAEQDQNLAHEPSGHGPILALFIVQTAMSFR